MKWLERILEWGGRKRDVVFLAVSGAALAASMAHFRFFGQDPAWAAILL